MGIMLGLIKSMRLRRKKLLLAGVATLIFVTTVAGAQASNLAFSHEEKQWLGPGIT